MRKVETVLITGASSGIGYELAKIFANHKYNLILVSRDENKLQKIANELTYENNISINVISEDLSVSGSANKIFEYIKSLSIEVDILINNAGVGTVGEFHNIELNKDIEMLQLNIVTLTELTKLFSKEMIKRKKGKILNLASTGSFHPGPFTAVYYATKAYVLSFSEAISKELEPYGITVSALCPGATKTNFAKRAGKRDTTGAMKPSVVAKIAYEGLMKNKRVIIPGILNKIVVSLPRNLMIKMIAKYQKSLAIKENK